jgi:O-succinylbenzoate synthase
VRDVVLVRAIAPDGREGWGECSALSSPGYTAETTASAFRALSDRLVPAWLRHDSVASDAPMAHAALETAAVDIELRRRGVSLTAALAASFGAPRRRLPWCAVLGLDATVADVDAALHAGARHVKVKVSPARDLAHVKAIRARFGQLALAVDANGSYSSVDAVPGELADLGLAYLEQPLAADDLRGSAEVARRLDVPVALDESISSCARLDDAIELGACSAVSIKPARLGGVVETARVLSRVQESGLSAFVGGMLETAVGRSVALAIAAQSPCDIPCDTGPTSRYFTTDVGEAFEADHDGLMRPADGPGIGRVPDADALARFTRDRRVLDG